MQYTFEQIVQITQANFTGNIHATVGNFTVDSRKITPLNITDLVFVALVTPKRNGHTFIPEAYQKGVRNFLVSEPVEFLSYKDVNIILVNNTLTALQQIAQFHRKQFSYPVIGITGSNGKTVVKEWLYHLLKDDFNIVRSPKSYNSQIGVPLSVLQMDKHHNLAIFEAGISQPNEMQILGKIIRPDMGIFVNIGSAHNENFNSIEEKVHEKNELFTSDTFVIYNKDYTSIDEVFKQHPESKKLVWSTKKSATFQISRIQKKSNITQIQAIYKNDFISIEIPFIDDASIENAIHCWVTLLYMGMPMNKIQQKMLTLTPIAMRLEVKEGVNNCLIINDSYNSDWASLEIALDFLTRQSNLKKNTLILSDLQQTGEQPEVLYRNVATLVKNKNIHQFFGVGEDLQKHQNFFDVACHFFSSTAQLLSYLQQHSFDSENILIKGSRSFEFEKISKFLQKKVHSTVLEINLNALEHNLNYYKSLLLPKTKIMVMVKALSYGSGTYEVANLLQFHKVDYLGVAFVDEGILLREAGITLPIMVMNPEPQGYDAMLEYDLEPEIYNWRSLQNIIQCLQKNNAKKSVSIHIKLDTGMHRLGFEPHEMAQLIQILQKNPQLKIASVFSHLATSDESSLSDFTLQQINLFKNLSGQLENALQKTFIKHILNSSGISEFTDAQMDMVRLGIGLYGVSPNPTHQKNLEVVSELFTSISQIKHVPKGDSVGYSRREIAAKDLKIATVPIGYADGLSRLMSNRVGHMLVNGKKAPIVGNICMDMTMLDITEIDAQEGDSVEVFGKNIPVQTLANWAQTISYEIFTSISPRVKRVYFQE
jgi:alanine racemase